MLDQAVSDLTVRDLLSGLSHIVAQKRVAREALALVWDCTPAWLAANGDSIVPERVSDAAVSAARRIAAGEPVAYATGWTAFRDLVLAVDDRVLIPRPETEIVVEEALRLCATGVAVDVGTGSGAIALSLATEGCFDRVVAIDVSSDALNVARLNAERLGVRPRVELRCGSLLDAMGDERVDLIVSNPPYIAAAEMVELPRSVRDWEPPIALASGTDGLSHTRRLISTAAPLLEPGGWLVLECDARRAEDVAGLVSRRGEYSDVRVRRDLAGRQRVVVARRHMENLN